MSETEPEVHSYHQMPYIHASWQKNPLLRSSPVFLRTVFPHCLPDLRNNPADHSRYPPVNRSRYYDPACFPTDGFRMQSGCAPYRSEQLLFWLNQIQFPEQSVPVQLPFCYLPFFPHFCVTLGASRILSVQNTIPFQLIF